MVSVLFSTTNRTTTVTCHGQEGYTTCWWNCGGALIERGALVCEVGRFGAQHILGVRLHCALLWEQTQNQNQIISWKSNRWELACRHIVHSRSKDKSICWIQLLLVASSLTFFVFHFMSTTSLLTFSICSCQVRFETSLLNGTQGGRCVFPCK